MAQMIPPKASLTDEELERLELESFCRGPLSILTKARENKFKIVIILNNRRKLLANVIGFDRHCNLVLENVRERLVSKNGKTFDQDIDRLFVRGDNVKMVHIHNHSDFPVKKSIK